MLPRPAIRVRPPASRALEHLLIVGDGGTWLEQVGELELLGGWAEVRLSDEFVAQIGTNGYDVFLSSYDAAVVFAQNRTEHSFEVHAMPGPRQRSHGTVRCAYRAMGRIKQKA